MKIKLIRATRRLVLVIIALAFIFFINGTIERQIVKKEIREFMLRGELLLPSTNFNYDINRERFYIVRSEYDYEDTSFNTYNHSTKFIGSTGDILITNRNPLPEISVLDPVFVHFWIGHAALVIEDDGSKILEIVGNDTLESNEVLISKNLFYLSYLKSEEVVGLRIKDIDQEKKEEIKVVKDSFLGLGYNFFFVIPIAKRYYCIDLITSVLEKTNININYDFWVSTGNDMIINKKTYIFYYSHVDKEGIVHKYFLVDKDFSI